MEKRQIESPKCQNGSPEWDAGVGEGGGGGGQFRHFSNNSTMKQYFKMLLSHGGVCFFSSPYCNVILCSSPFCVLCGGNWHLTLWGRDYKRAPKLVVSPQSTTLYSTGNISAEDSVHKNKVGHNNTRGIVSSLLFFLLKITAAQSLHFQRLMWTEVISSRRL